MSNEFDRDRNRHPEQPKGHELEGFIHGLRESTRSVLANHPNLHFILQTLTVVLGGASLATIMLFPEVKTRNIAVMGLVAASVLGLLSFDSTIEQKRGK